MMELALNDVSPLPPGAGGGWLLTGTDRTGREWHAVADDPVGQQIHQQVAQIADTDQRVVVDLDQDKCVPAVELRPCPLCGHPDAWQVPTVHVSLITSVCDGCGRTLSGSNVPPDLAEQAGVLIDMVEADSGQAILTDRPVPPPTMPPR